MSKTFNDFVEEAKMDVQEISIELLEDLQTRVPDLIILDVREPYEFEKGHVPGSILIPRGLLESAADRSTEHNHEALDDPDRTIVIVCDSGDRSALACYTLQLMGFESVYNLAGGMEQWISLDLPMDTGPYTGKLP